MAPGLRVLLFGDQTVQTKAAIQSLIQHSKNSELLQTFLVDAEDVIRIKVAQLENSDKKRFDGFLSLVGLAERHDASEFPDDIRATALITIAQLGELILYVSVRFTFTGVANETPDSQKRTLAS